MTEADILAMTYEDTVTVYRPFKSTLPSGETVFKKDGQGQAVYRDVPCALSGQTGGGLERELPAGSVPTQFCLFVRPEVETEPNDYLVVHSRGRDVKALAGLADRKQSHNNIPLVLDKERV